MKKIAFSIILLIIMCAAIPIHADTFTWTFNTAEYYTPSDASKVEITDGMAQLIPIDQTDDDNSSMGFAGGEHNETDWIVDHLELTESGKTNGSGIFTSRVIDAGTPVAWENLHWDQFPQNALFAVDSYEDIYRSVDGGITWEKVNFDFAGDTTDAIDIIHAGDKTMYIVDGDSRVLSSSDEGATWNAVNLDFNGAESNYPEEILLDQNNYMYVVETDDDVWNSNDRGSTWTKVNDDYDLADNTSVRGMVSNESSVFIIAANGKVWRSDDTGTTWTEINVDYNMGDGGTPSAVTADDTSIYIAESDGDVWRSDTWGISFAKVCDDFDLTTVASPLALTWDEKGIVYLASNENDLYMSDDYGVSWIKISTDFLVVCRGLEGSASGIKFQIRSDDDNSNWPDFTGPDGTSSTFYTDADSLLNVSPNRYIQYRAYFSTNDSTYTSELQRVILGPGHYTSTTPNVVNSLTQSFTSLSYFVEELGTGHGGAVEYQLSNDSLSWYYWNGSEWTEQTGQGYQSETNTAEEINAVIDLFSVDVGSGDFYFKAFLNSYGSQPVELDTVQIGFDPDPLSNGSSDPPIIDRLYPNTVTNTEDVAVVIIGENFIATPQVRIGGVGIAGVNLIGAGELEIVIPQGFLPGTYDVLVINPDNRSSVIEDGIIVEDQSAPEILQVFPNSGTDDTSTDIVLIGTNFKEGLLLQLGEIEIENTVLVNSNMLTASIPPGMTPGIYDMEIINIDDRSGRLENSFTVLPSCTASCDIKIFPNVLFGSRWLPRSSIMFISLEDEGCSFGKESEIIFDPPTDLRVLFKLTFDNRIVAAVVVNRTPSEGVVSLTVSNIFVSDEIACESNETASVIKEDALTITMLPWILEQENHR